MDIRPFKLALVTCVRRWSYAFKKHLTDNVVNSLAELNDFIDKADEGLMTQVDKDRNLATLYNISNVQCC